MRACLLVCLVFGVGCFVPTSDLDAGSGDGGIRFDGGPGDGGAADSGAADAGTDGGGSDPDAGPVDAGPPDAGPPDAGPPDAGPPDAGPVDGGVVVDAGPQCTLDTQCPAGQLCTANLCVVRPIALDGGFACAQACDCRQGEWCQDGGCFADPIVPTFFIKEGGFGPGTTSLAPAGDLRNFLLVHSDNQVFALRAGDSLSDNQPFAINGSGVTVVGGYAECAPGRWVRDPLARTRLSVDAGDVVDINRTNLGLVEISDIRVMGLDLYTTQCSFAQLHAINVRRLEVNNVRGSIGPPQACTGVVACDRCPEALIRDVVMMPSSGTAGWVVQLSNGDGTIQGTRLELQLAPMPWMTMVRVMSATGLVKVLDSQMAAISSPSAIGIDVQMCAPQGVEIERNRIAWASQSQFTGIRVVQCAQHVVVANNLIDGTGALSSYQNTGMLFADSSADLHDNVVWLPTQTTNGGNRGVEFLGGRSPIDLYGNHVAGGGGLYGTTGISLDFLEPARLRRNIVNLGGVGVVTGLEAWNSRGLVLEDNLFMAGTPGNCATSAVSAARLRDVALRADRNQFFASSGEGVSILRGQAELTSNHLWVGSGCASTAVTVDTAQVYLQGNTLDPNGDPLAASRGITCGSGTAEGQVIAEGNIIGTGAGTDHQAVYDNSVLNFCSHPSDWRSNYFWTRHPSGQLYPSDRVRTLVQADAGERDVRGNLFNFDVSCFADAGQPADGGVVRPYRLAPGSPCVDTGQLLFTTDGGLIEFDLDGQSRLDAGLPDIGCSELH